MSSSSHTADRPTAEAVAAAEAAVSSYRELAATDPERRTGLGVALRDLGVHLARAGRYRDAVGACVEAIGVFRQLPAERFERFGPDLADTLYNLGLYLQRLQRPIEALEAARELVTVRGLLAKGEAGSHDRALGSATHQLASQLWDAGAWSDAIATMEHAVDLRRQLATDGPGEPGEEELSLAWSLELVADWLVEQERYDEAVAAHRERVATLQRPVKENPENAPVLAGAVNGLCQLFAKLGRQAEAAEVANEAVTFARQLAAADPTGTGDAVAHLALCLSWSGLNQWQAGRRDEAVANTVEAIELLRHLATDELGAFHQDLADNLDHLAIFLNERSGDHEASLAVAREAVDLRRRLVADEPQRHLARLAHSLSFTSERLADLGRHDESLRASAESIRLFVESADQLAGDADHHTERALSRYLNACQQLGQPPDDELVQAARGVAS